MVSFYCSTINGFLQSTWGVSLPCCGSPPVIFRFTDFLKQIHFFKLSSWGRSRFPGSRPHLWSSVSPCPEEPLSQALVFTCRHNIPLEALQYWAGCKQPVPHFKCESHGWYGEKPLASVQCNMASLPLVRRPSPSGLFSQPFCSCCLISVDRSLPAAILFLTSSRFFPSFHGAAPLEQTQCSTDCGMCMWGVTLAQLSLKIATCTSFPSLPEPWSDLLWTVLSAVTFQVMLSSFFQLHYSSAGKYLDMHLSTFLCLIKACVLVCKHTNCRQNCSYVSHYRCFSWSWKCKTKTFVAIKHFRKSF